MNNTTIIKTNNDGWQLVKGEYYWSIIKPLADGSNNVAHVGRSAHVKRMWNTRFAKIVEIDNRGLRWVRGVDSSLTV